MQVVTAVGTVAEKAENQQSQQVAAAALQAVGAAWLAAGRGFPELAEAALSSTRNVAAPRALPLLSALIAAVPQVGIRIHLSQFVKELGLRVQGFGVQDEDGVFDDVAVDLRHAIDGGAGHHRQVNDPLNPKP